MALCHIFSFSPIVAPSFSTATVAIPNFPPAATKAVSNNENPLASALPSPPELEVPPIPLPRLLCCALSRSLFSCSNSSTVFAIIFS